MKNLSNPIESLESLSVSTAEQYHNLVNIYSKNTVDSYLDKIIEKKLSNCITSTDKIAVWDQYSYYLATKDHSIYEQKELEKLATTEYLTPDKYLSLKLSLIYGLHLISKQHLVILKDITNDTTLDIEKIFSSIKTIATRDYVLNKLNNFYKNSTRTSLNDKSIKDFLTNYSNLCQIETIPNLDNLFSSPTKTIPEDYLIEQIDMYIRYCNAKEIYIKHNIGLVKYVINKVLKLQLNECEDLISEGYLSLIKAVDTYDIRTGNVFSSYAVTVIKRDIKRLSNKYDYGITLPVEKYLDKFRITNKRNELSHILKRNPTTKELASYLEISETKLLEFLSILNQTNYLSLNAIIEDEKIGSFTLGETIIDEKAEFMKDIIKAELLKIILSKIDELLTPTEKDVLFKRTGYNTLDQMPLTLDELSQEKNLSIEGIRKIEARALKKLRRNNQVIQANPFD